jgi:cytochrome bd-type quinol oxidase subunit 2
VRGVVSKTPHPVNNFWWYANRATGIVATVLAAAALVSGSFFSSRNTGERRRPAWWLDLHNLLGGIALAFTAAHLTAVYLDSRTGLSLVELFVPGTTPWALTWGVAATYLFAVAVFTTWPRRLRRPRLWRVVHLGSIVGVAAAGLHAYQSGSDRSALAFEAGLLAITAIGIYAVGVRLFAVAAGHANSLRTPSRDQANSDPHTDTAKHDKRIPPTDH